MVDPTAHLLLEIGVEELPASFVDAALAGLPEIVVAKLAEVRLTHGDVRAFGTPRRLAVVVHDVASRQPDVDEEMIGPPENVAFKDGKATKAAEAFAAKLGIDVSNLAVAEKVAAGKQKAGRFVIGRRLEKGRAAPELLPKVLAQVCAGIPFKKSMRWGDGDATFGRPVHWLVALFGPHLLDVSFAGVRAGRLSRGHRFLAPAEFAIESADTYADQLRQKHVLVDREERKRTMMDRVQAAAKAAGETHDHEPSLIDENASLVEEPHVITGSFDPSFLELPAAVIRAVARGHQKYFTVQRTDRARTDTGMPHGAGALASGAAHPLEDDLVPHYIAVANTANNPERITKGNDRVMRARLADARFFFEEDKKAKISDRVEKLATIVFHKQLGTVLEKVQRIERLAVMIGARLGLPVEQNKQIVRAAHLCKFDLVSLMVGEFPELQGHMGRAYAKHAGEPDSIADAIRDHYRPVGASDKVAPDDISAVVAISDRVDTLTGCFGIGLEPSGTADPYALRRACIATLRTLLDKGVANPRYARLNLHELAILAYEGYDEQGKRLRESREETTRRIEEFASERLRGLLASTASNAVADAVLAGYHEVSGVRSAVTRYPVYALAKTRALQTVVDEKQPWLGKAKTVAKRLHGISKESDPRLHPGATFARAEDAAIVKVVEDADRMTRELYDELTIRRALASTEELAQRVDEIFVSTLVNDPNDPKTPLRLELLSYGAQCMLRIADFSKLP